MSDLDPATPQQLDCLKQLGIRITKPISQSTAAFYIEHYQATPKQHQCLSRLGIQGDESMTRSEAQDLIGEKIAFQRHLSPTAKQERFLRQRDLWKNDLSRGEAKDLIGQIMSGNYPPRPKYVYRE